MKDTATKHTFAGCPNSREEAELLLYRMCRRRLDQLCECIALHSTIDPPGEDAADMEIALRLRKVYSHVRAVAWWEVDAKYAMHAMFPDVLVAREQLEPILQEHDDSYSWHDHIRKEKKGLEPFVHPTSAGLALPCHRGGFGESDTVLYLSELYMVLSGLLTDYGFALGVMADALNHPDLSRICDRLSGMIGECRSLSLGEILRFVQQPPGG